ncbi:MAG: STAS domain-containing protein [Candidatus Poribacteria bacterium]|nr:STAS domain-containing protein [Candidatus Poribacteria bacterium]
MFETTISKHNIPILRVEGKILGNAAHALRREMDKQIEKSEGRLILDLTNVPLLDSSALGMIIAILQFLKKQGGMLVLLNPQKAVMNVLQVTRLNTILEIYMDEESAINAFDPDG